MCVSSMIADHYADKFRMYPSYINTYPTFSAPTRTEFEELKKEVMEMKALLIKAQKYDEEHNQPHCEKQEKVELLKQVAKLVGVDLGDLIA